MLPEVSCLKTLIIGSSFQSNDEGSRSMAKAPKAINELDQTGLNTARLSGEQEYAPLR